MIPLFLPGSLVCKLECDLAPAALKPLQLDSIEGDSDWAGRMMMVDSGAIMRCIACCCPGSSCEGAEYRVNSYTGQVLCMPRSSWAWSRVKMKPDDVDVLFPKAFPSHQWRNVGS
jgi:hypothetical protein